MDCLDPCGEEVYGTENAPLGAAENLGGSGACNSKAFHVLTNRSPNCAIVPW